MPPPDAATDSSLSLQARMLLALTIALAFAFAVAKVTSFDTWVHLSLGRWMAEHRSVPRANLLSFAEPDRPVLDHQWLFQAGLYAVERTIGISGAILLKAAFVGAAAAFLLATALRKGSRVLAACLLVLVGLAAARFRFTLRPQVVGFLLLSAYVFILERWRQGSPRGLLWLLPLQVLWANVHGGSLIGWALPLAYAAGESVRALLATRLRGVAPTPRPWRDLALLWAVAAALVPLTLLNPNGVRLLTLPFTHAAAQSASGLKELLLDRAAVAWADLGGRHMFFMIMAVLGLVSLIGSLVRKDVTELGLFAGLLWAAMHSERFIDLFAVAAAPIAAANLSAMLGRLSRALRPGLAAGLAFLAVGLVGCLGLTQAAREMPFGLGLAPGWFPAEEVAWLQANHPTGKLFNEFEHGGFVYWNTRRPVFLDSRGMPAYDPSLMKAYVGAWASREAWRELMARYDIAVALVQRKPLRQMFDTSPDWRLLHEGPVCSVYARKAN